MNILSQFKAYDYLLPDNVQIMAQLPYSNTEQQKDHPPEVLSTLLTAIPNSLNANKII